MRQITRTLLLVLTTPIISSTVIGQTVIGTHEDVRLDSPEGWAMAYMTAAALNLGQQPPEQTEFGDLKFAAELGSIPHLSREQQSIGFSGFKHEDLNKSPVFGRARASVGLLWDVTAELTWTPPLELKGAKPDDLWGLALSRPLYASSNWALGLRVFALYGAVTADVTCSDDIASKPPGSAENPFSCLEPSEDRLEMDHYGAELILSTPNILGLNPWVSIAAVRLDPFVEVNALVLGAVDYSTIDSEGSSETVSGGVSFRFNDNWGFTLAGSYTPLDVKRPNDPDDLDDFWSIRLGLVWDF